MKVATLIKPALITAGIAFLFGCQKEVLRPLPMNQDLVVSPATRAAKQYQLKGQASVSWNTILPVSGNDFYTYGKGESHSTIIGKGMIYFNTKSTYPDTTKFVHAAVKDISAYSSELSQFDLTQDVTVIMFDNQGNSIWSKLIESSGRYTYGKTLYDPIKVDGAYHIINGTGIFKGATGNFAMEGYWTRTQILDLTGNTSFSFDGQIWFNE